MGFTDFLETSRSWVEEEGLLGGRYVLDQIWMGILRRTAPFFEEGTNVYEKDWDVLIVLDGCRVDVMADVADEYSFLDAPDTHRSTASTSGEWMRTTFTDAYDDQIRDTIYVTANQHSEEVADAPFHRFEDVYEYGWDSEVDTIPADVVTDVAIEAGRAHLEPKRRMIVHYMQPHFPSVPRPLGHGNKFNNVWKGLMIGRGDVDEVWESYVANLHYVLTHVETLLENLNANTVVISADHGNAKGEWGVYAHPLGVPIDCVKTVPWYRTSATDERTRTPSPKRDTGEGSTSVEDRLRSLGYL